VARHRTRSFNPGLIPALIHPGSLTVVVGVLSSVLTGAVCGNLWASSNESLWGRIVANVRLENDGHLKLSDFQREITQQKGEPLDRFQVAESLKNLYATGRFGALAADAEPQGQEVVLIFRARVSYFVGIVRVEGAPKHVDAAALASATRLRLGEPLSRQGLNEAADRLVSMLKDNAYYQARVSVSESRRPDSQEADVIFSVTAGPPARLAGVEFRGNSFFPATALLKAARWRAGIQLTSARLERGLTRLHDFYTKRNYLEAAISARQRTYDPKTGAERLIVQADAGPEVHIHVTGARISASDLREILPAYRQASTDELTLRDGEQALANYFEERGYFSAQARLTQRAAAGDKSLDVTYTVSLGPKGTFVGYGFRGNHSIASGELGASVSLQPAGTFRLKNGRFDRSLLDGSIRALASLYHSRGFLEARISVITNENYGGQPNQLFVTFNVEEGSLTHVRRVTVSGVSEETQKQIGSLLLTGPGKPYSPERARTDRGSILDYLANHGYSQATVDWHASKETPGHEVDLEYHIDPGRRQTIERVVVLGNRYTRDSVIDDQLTFEEGEPLSQSSLLESQQRLYDLGLFNQVQIATQAAGSAETEKTVLVGLEEAKRWTLGYGGGIDVQRLPSNEARGTYGVSPRVSLEVDRSNLGGRPQTFSLLGHVSNLEKIGSTRYTIPQFLGHRDLTLRITGLLDQSRNVLTFDSKRQEVSVILQKQYGPHTSLLGRYDFRNVAVSNLHINPASIPLVSQAALVATLGGTYINDHRDNPVDATQGSYSVVDANVAWDKLGSSADFFRISGQNSTYYRLSSRVVFARDTLLGLEPTFGHTSVPDGVPLPERLFMGGPDSHRGFSLNEAGPRDTLTGFPIGGRALFLNQVELRVAVERSRLGLVLFEDAGNAYSSLGRMRLLKVSQSSPTDFDYTVHAAGLGVRYQTPVGPLRFDVGYSLNPPRFQQCTVSASVCPAGSLEVLRLPNFQFFLGIGQSF
jgi:outer membrane protein insertion porin family